MFNQTQAFRQYLKKRQDKIDFDKPQEQENQISSLFNEKTFYHTFIKDMLEAEKEIIIYSPFITKFRSDFFRRTLEKLKRRNINVFIFTRPLEEHDLLMRSEITCALRDYEEQGVSIFYLEGYIHEKIAVIDREILWEGSLNILSQRISRELMRRTTDESSAMQVINYLGLNRRLVEGYKLRYERLCKGLISDQKRNIKLKVCVFLLGLSISLIIQLILYIIKSMN